MIKNFLQFEATAESLEKAVEMALSHFGCTRAEIDVDVLSAPSAGFFGFFRKPARIQARLTDRAYIGSLICQQLLDRVGFDGQCQPSLGSDRIDLLISGEDVRSIIGRKGQCLDALQYLVVALADRVTEDRMPLILDSDDYRQKRQAFLRRLARRLVAQVKKSGKPVTVQPLPPQERRVLHLTLETEDAVDVKSVGQGYERKMVISPR